MPQARIVIARPPTRNRAKKPPAAALTGPRIVAAQKPGLKRYSLPAAEDPEASAAIREWLERAKWGRGPSQ